MLLTCQVLLPASRCQAWDHPDLLSILSLDLGPFTDPGPHSSSLWLGEIILEYGYFTRGWQSRVFHGYFT